MPYTYQLIANLVELFSDPLISYSSFSILGAEKLLSVLGGEPRSEETSLPNVLQSDDST